MSIWILAAALAGATADVQQAIATVRQAGPLGQGGVEAASAWRTIAAADVGAVPDILAGMDGANPIAQNWLRAAADPVIARARAEHRPLPVASLEAFLAERRHDARARRLAYELIVEADAAARERLLPGLIDDPSAELRHDAVAAVLADAEKQSSDKTKAATFYEHALTYARDKEQIDKAAKQLKALGRPVDLPRKYGLVLEWKLIGPFPNPPDESASPSGISVASKGAAIAYPPEKGIDLAGAYAGQAGKVKWKDVVTPSEAGQVDVLAALGKTRTGVAYALAEFTSDKEQAVDLRLSSICGLKVWVNGEQVLERYDAYTGVVMDTYVAKARLRAGKNQILIKLWKDEPPEPRLDKWWFALRVCDAAGGAILSTNRPASGTPGKKG